MRNFRRILRVAGVVLIVFSLAACQPEKETVEVTILQINDVYDISPSASDNLGGLSRVATLKKRLLAENSNTIMVLGGDFLNPSFIGNLPLDSNRKVAGKHMVEVLNVAGLDYATFGNHEFDISFDDLQSRLNESKFTWFTSNVNYAIPNGIIPFKQGQRDVPKTVVRIFSNEKGQNVRLGMFSSLLPFNKRSYVNYGHVYNAPKHYATELRNRADVVLGLTHLDLAQDKELARILGDVPLFMGGHEHHGVNEWEGKTHIVKAKANAKTAYVHNVTYNVKTKEVEISSKEVLISDSIPEDSATAAVVMKWEQWADSVVASKGVNPNVVVHVAQKAMDARESQVRKFQTSFGQWTCDKLLRTSPACDFCFINSGSIRYDDILPIKLAVRDIFTAYPFGGGLSEAVVSGADLKKILTVGSIDNMGSGGYLQYSSNTKFVDGQWLINGEPIQPQQSYRVLTSDFLLSGKEKGLGFMKDLKTESYEYPKAVGIENDIRSILSVVEE